MSGRAHHRFDDVTWREVLSIDMKRSFWARPTKNETLWVLLFLVGIAGCALLCVPLRELLFSGKEQASALLSVDQLFVDLLVDALRHQDYAWLAERSSEEAFQRLLNLRCAVGQTYHISIEDGSRYERAYNILFDNSTDLWVELIGGYYDPLDRRPSDEELLETIQLENISCAGN